ncbi:MAG: hypothetical protein GY856_16920, partial [bacterium]|nr:hypothetical protein [bacterium]
MLLGRVLLAAASAEFHLGKISNAITGARSALRLIPPADPLYYLAGLHNLAWYVSHTDSRDDLKEALETLEHAWKSVRGRTKPYRTIRIRIRSTRAVVRYRLG